MEAARSQREGLELRGSGVQEPREPSKWYTEHTAVTQMDPEAIFIGIAR